MLIRPVINEIFVSFHFFIAESKVFQCVLIRPTKNERVRFVALSVFIYESNTFQHVLISFAKNERGHFLRFKFSVQKARCFKMLIRSADNERAVSWLFQVR